MATTPIAQTVHGEVTGWSAVPGRLAEAGHETWQRWRRQRHWRKGMLPQTLAFTSYGSTGWVRILARVVLAPTVDSTPAILSALNGTLRGWKNFTRVPLAFATGTVTIGDTTHPVRANKHGVIDAVVPATLEPGWETAVLRIDGAVSTEVAIMVVEDQPAQAVICDVDDTVVVTALNRPLTAAWNAFVVREAQRQPVPGMASLLEAIAPRSDANIFYVSTGTWSVGQLLSRFLNKHGFPAGPMMLTSWGPTKGRIFRSGTEHKRATLARLAREFPQLNFILVGDDAQKDPETYAHFAARHTGRVDAIAIRSLLPPGVGPATGRLDVPTAETPDVPWVYASHGDSLARALIELGLVDDVDPETASAH